MMTDLAIAYAWRQLALRAGIAALDCDSAGFEKLGLTVHYACPETVTAQGSALVVAPCSAANWHEILTQPPGALQWLPRQSLLPAGACEERVDRLPVLFWGAGYADGCKPFAEQRRDGTVVFYADILAATVFMLSRWEETVVQAADQHDRFPASASVAYKQGFLDRPVIDEYALVLRSWLRILRPDLPAMTPRFSIRLTHDIDSVHRFASPLHAAKSSVTTLSTHRSVRRAASAASTAVTMLMGRKQPVNKADLEELAAISESNGFVSTFNFMAAEHGQHDIGYNLGDPTLRRCIDALAARGHEIGFHPGYTTFGNPQQLIVEKSRFVAAVGRSPSVSRQHYLRFRAPATWLHCEDAGLACDSTLGYADQEGFRCGTCRPFHPFDVSRNRVLKLFEEPLLVMDQTLIRYRRITPAAARARILEIAATCKAVNGVFTLLWHNTSLHDGYYSWAQMYRQVVADLAALK